MVYKTPVQLIYSVDKAIGGYITVRQFFYLLAGLALAGLFYLPFWGHWSFLTAIVVILACEIPFGMLAFMKAGYINLDEYILGFVHYKLSPIYWPEVERR